MRLFIKMNSKDQVPLHQNLSNILVLDQYLKSLLTFLTLVYLANVST